MHLSPSWSNLISNYLWLFKMPRLLAIPLPAALYNIHTFYVLTFDKLLVIHKIMLILNTYQIVNILYMYMYTYTCINMYIESCHIVQSVWSLQCSYTYMYKQVQHVDTCTYIHTCTHTCIYIRKIYNMYILKRMSTYVTTY